MRSKAQIFAGVMLVVFVLFQPGHIQSAWGQQAAPASQPSQAAQMSTAMDEMNAIGKEMNDSEAAAEKQLQEMSQQKSKAADNPAVAQTGGLRWPGTRTVEASDPRYQMTAMTLAIPATWKFAGEMGQSGAGSCHATDWSLKMTAVSSNGLFQIMQIPGVMWNVSFTPQMEQQWARTGCHSIGITSAADYMANILLPQLHPNAKIVQVAGPDAELEEEMQKQFEKVSANQAIWSRGTGQPQAQLSYDGARMLIEYDVEGKPVEELLSGFVQCSAMGWANGPFLRSCVASNTSLVRAPQGQLGALLAMPEFVAMMKSHQPNPDWVSRMAYEGEQQRQQGIAQIVQSQRLTQQMIAQSNAAANARMQASQRFADVLSQGNQQFINAMQARTNQSIAADQSRQAHMDAEAHQYTLFAGDEREFTNPYNGQTVVSSNRYQQQWISSDGQTVAMTNNWANPNDYVAPGGPTFAPMIPK